MSIHPIVQDFLNHAKSDLPEMRTHDIDIEKWKSSFEYVDRCLSNMTPEQKEEARNKAHHWLFGKVIDGI